MLRACYISHNSHPFLFNCPNNIKLKCWSFSLCNFSISLLHRSATSYYPRHFVLKHLTQSTFFCLSNRRCFTSILVRNSYLTCQASEEHYCDDTSRPRRYRSARSRGTRTTPSWIFVWIYVKLHLHSLYPDYYWYYKWKLRNPSHC